MKHKAPSLAALAAMLAIPALAQQFVYPAKGQSPKQQQKDESACYSWAVKQSGFDPANPKAPPPAAAPPTTATGVTPGAGAVGAVKGAVVGEVVGGDAGKGAALGAVVARNRSRQQNAQNAQQQQAAAVEGQHNAFAKARSACLEGKGYTVK